MNTDQKEMLSVKNAIERMVQGQISSFSNNADSHSADQLFSQVDCFIAGLYVSGQIESVYSVHVNGIDQLDISFGCAGQKSTITFLLPHQLRFKREVAPARTKLSLISDIVDIRFDLSAGEATEQVRYDLQHFINLQPFINAVTEALEETHLPDITYVAFGEWEEVAKAEEIQQDVADGITACSSFDDMSQRLLEWSDEQYAIRQRKEAALYDEREARDLISAYERAKKVR